MCDALDLPYRVALVPCGTREYGYLAQCPRRCIDKLKGHYAALQVRHNHSQEGRTKHSVSYWVALGQTVASMELVVFVLCLVDILESHDGYIGSAQHFLANRGGSSILWLVQEV